MESTKYEMESLRLINEMEQLIGHATRTIRSHRREPEFNVKRSISWFSAIVIIAGLLVGAITGNATAPAQRASKPLAAVLAPEQPWTIASEPTGHMGAWLHTQTPGADALLELAALIKPKPVPVIVAPPAPVQPVIKHVVHNQPPAPAVVVAAGGKVSVVIAYALRQRGKPYVFGTSGPNTFDCSGLVLAAYAQIGIHMHHFTGAMLGYGTRVDRAGMRPGDLVFPSSSHVGIYLGNNQMIVAPHSGTVVQIQTVYSFYAARRIVG